MTNRTRKDIETAFTYGMGRRRMYNAAGEPWTPFLSDPEPTGYKLDSDGKTVRNAAGEIVFCSLQPGRTASSRVCSSCVPITTPGETQSAQRC